MRGGGIEGLGRQPRGPSGLRGGGRTLFSLSSSSPNSRVIVLDGREDSREVCRERPADGSEAAAQVERARA